MGTSTNSLDDRDVHLKRPSRFKHHNERQRDSILGSAHIPSASSTAPPHTHPATHNGDLDALVRAAIEAHDTPAGIETMAQLETMGLTKKRIKRMKQKVKRGETLLSFEAYRTRMAEIEQRGKDEDGNYAIIVPEDRYVPEDVRKDNFEQTDPELYPNLVKRGRSAARAHKNDASYRTRVIWLNELDRSHSFSKRHKQCRVLFAILNHRYEGGERLRMIDLLYIAACLEWNATSMDHAENTFEHRERFVEYWLQSDSELYIFRQPDWRRYREFNRTYKNFNKDMSAALPPQALDSNFVASMAVFETVSTSIRGAVVGQPEKAADGKPPSADFEDEDDDSEDGEEELLSMDKDDVFMQDNQLPVAKYSLMDMQSDLQDILTHGIKNGQDAAKVSALTRSIKVEQDWEKMEQLFGQIKLEVRERADELPPKMFEALRIV